MPSRWPIPHLRLPIRRVASDGAAGGNPAGNGAAVPNGDNRAARRFFEENFRPLVEIGRAHV